MTDRYSAPPTVTRIRPDGSEAPADSDARRGRVAPAPDYRQQLRDLYARRNATTKADPEAARERGDAITRTLAPRYETKLRSDVDAARETTPPPSVTPRPATPTPAPTPGLRPADPGKPIATPRPVTPVTGRYPVPGRTPRIGAPPRVAPAPRPADPGRPGLTPRTDPTERGGTSPRPGSPTLRPAPESNSPRVRPSPRPTRPADVVARGGSRGGDPTLNPPGDRGGRGPRFGDHWNRYNGWSYAGSHRYAYGCYHWSGHYACFWPTRCGWGWYWYPYLYCGSWSRYWYNCNSSFAVYTNSFYPSSWYATWWWPSSCYLPGSWYGYGGFGGWSDDYVDWSYSPPGRTTEVEVAADPGVEAPADEPTPEIDDLARKHVNLGDYYFREGRYVEAAESYVRALAYAPDDGALHFVLADALFAQGDYHYAAYMIGKALALDPGLASATADKRAFYGDPKEFDAQLTTLRGYIDEKPYDAAANLVLGYNLKFSGDADGATKAFERVLEIDPGNESARAFLAALAAPIAPDRDGDGR